MAILWIDINSVMGSCMVNWIGGYFMAEFGQVIYEWRRLCTHQQEKHDGIYICEDCPMDVKDLCCKWPDESDENDIKEIERIVMEWAKEHPEPEYPTWAEWLEEMGVIKTMELGGDGHETFYALDGFTNRLPKHITEKLGIKPKNYDMYKEVLEWLQKEKKDD